MEDLENEFHLEEAGADGWFLTQVHTRTYRFQSRERQPGEPSHQSFEVENPWDETELGLILTAVGGEVASIRIEVDGIPALNFDATLQEGETLVYSGGDTARLYSPQWRVLGTLPMDPEAVKVDPGEHRIVVDARVAEVEDAYLKLEFRLDGVPEAVARRN
jgi:hypothetical protein